MEPHAGVRRLLARVLTDAGYAVEFTCCTDLALGARAEGPELLVVDATGRAAATWRLLRKTAGDAGDARRVVVMAPLLECRGFLRAGAAACLPKPFPIRELLRACDAALAGGPSLNRG